MAKYINADALLDKIERMWNAHQLTNTKYKTFVDLLKAEPAADVVEVVRCKDCRYMLQTEGCALDRDRFMREEEDYCSYGEREDG